MGTGVYLPDILIKLLGRGKGDVQDRRIQRGCILNWFRETSKEWIDEWNKMAPDREKASRWWKGVMADNLGNPSTPQEMNEMVERDLDRQLANGEFVKKRTIDLHPNVQRCR